MGWLWLVMVVTAWAQQEFVYPVSAWVTADEVYVDGTEHTGSADLSAPHFTPVGASRAGWVDFVTSAGDDVHVVTLRHELVDGHYIYTSYGHLATAPLVALGQWVEVNEPLGYVGRTGYANNPHVHWDVFHDLNDDGSNGEFAFDDNGVLIEFRSQPGERLDIPEIDWGDWVMRGDWVDAGYGLPPIADRRLEQDDLWVEVIDGPADVYALDGTVAEIAADGSWWFALTKVSGMWLVERPSAPGEYGLVADSAAAPYGAAPLTATIDDATVYRDRALSQVEDTHPTAVAGHAVAVFDCDETWGTCAFLWPTAFGHVYRWADAAALAESPRFTAIVSTGPVQVFDTPDATTPQLGVTLDMLDPNNGKYNVVEVLQVSGGWYEIERHEVWDDWTSTSAGAITHRGWIPGWATVGVR